MPRTHSPVFLLLDLHYGLLKMNKASLEMLGHQTLPMCGSYHYLQFERSWLRFLSRAYRRGLCLNNSHILRQRPGQTFAERSRVCADKLAANKLVASALKACDYIVCSFPPALVFLARELAKRYGKKIFLICGHRFHIHLHTRSDVARIKRIMRMLAEDKANIVAVYGDYEARYMRYFMPELSFHALPLTTPHVPLSLPAPPTASPPRFLLYSCDSDPQYIRQRHPIFAPLLAHPRASMFRFCHRAMMGAREIARLNLFRGGFPMSLADRFQGVICWPYSAYSVMLCELFELNIPIFAPSPRLLMELSEQSRNVVKDRAVFSIYCDKKTYKNMQADDDERASPNSYHPDALKIWLPRMELYRRKHTMMYDSIDELMDKLARFSRSEVSAAMLEENRIRRQAAQDQWRALIDKAWAANPRRP